MFSNNKKNRLTPLIFYKTNLKKRLSEIDYITNQKKFQYVFNY